MSSIDKSQIVGVLLAGGLSRRMGGGDKCLANLGGRTMLAHSLARLQPQVSTIILNANGEPARFGDIGLPVVADPVDGFVGPLAGVLAGMQWTRANRPDASHIATASTDAPFLPLDLVTRLAAALGSQPRHIALASSGGHLHPVIGLWPVALADDLEAQLLEGTRKVLHWTDRHGTVAVEFPLTEINGNAVDPFFNANRPEELDEARRIIAG